MTALPSLSPRKRQYIGTALLLSGALLSGCEHINLTHYSQLEQTAEKAEPHQQETGPKPSQVWHVSNSGWWQRMMQESLQFGPYTVANYRPGWIKENSSYPGATEVRRETQQDLSFDLNTQQRSVLIECEYRSVEQGHQGRRSVGGLAAKTIREAKTVERQLNCHSEQKPLWSWQWSPESEWTGTGQSVEASPHSEGIQFTAAGGNRLAIWQTADKSLSWQSGDPGEQQKLAISSAVIALILSGQSAN